MIFNKNQKRKYAYIFMYILEINVLKIESCYQYCKLGRYAEVQTQYGFRLIRVEKYIRICRQRNRKI